MYKVAIAPDGTWLATASLDATRIWAADGTPRATFGYPVGAPRVAIAPDGAWLATANNKTARIWAADGTPRDTLTGHKKAPPAPPSPATRKWWTRWRSPRTGPG